jgi:flagellar basal-body rod modification protein FlgD
MTVINPTATAPSANAALGGSLATGFNQLDNTQTFLNLLVAQLKNQNPDNPTDPTAFMTEIAQLTAVQSQTTLNADEETVAADSMLGRIVTGTGSGGSSVTGVVAAVLLSASGKPELELAGGQGTLDLSAVSAVYGVGVSNPPAGNSNNPSSSTSNTPAPSSSTATA